MRAGRLAMIWIGNLDADPPEAMSILAHFAAECGDPVLLSRTPPIATAPPAWLLWLDLAIDLARDRCNAAKMLVENLEPPADVGVRAFVQQFSHVSPLFPSKPTFGRNEPCPCGSGKKYKRCHGADPGAAVARALQRGAETLTEHDVLTMPLAELGDVVRRRAARLGIAPLTAAGGRLIKYRAWDHAEIVVDELCRRPDVPALVKDQTRLQVAGKAIGNRRFDLARKLVATLRTRREVLAPILEMAIALHERRPDALDRLLAVTNEAAKDDTAYLATELVSSLVKPAPGLALLLSRGCLHLDQPGITETILLRAESARLSLGLPNGDPGWDAYAALRQADELRRADATAQTEAARLRDSLADASRRSREMARRIRELEQEVAQRATPRMTSSSNQEPGELRALVARRRARTASNRSCRSQPARSRRSG